MLEKRSNSFTHYARGSMPADNAKAVNVSKRIRNIFAVCAIVVALLVLGTLVFAANVNTGVDGLTADSSGSATWTPSGGTITGSVKANKTSGCTGDSFTAQSGTLTFTNDSGATALLSFDYSLTLSGGTATVDGSSASAGAAFSKKLNSGDTVAVSITSNAGNEDATTITISNIKLTPEQNVTVTFKAPVNGTYTVDGTAVAADTAVTKLTTDSFALAATAASGYKFIGWYSETEDNYFATTAALSTSFTSAQTVYPVFVSSSSPVFQVGTKLFTDLNEAVSYSQSGGLPKIVLISDGTLPAGDYTIPSGKTLLIPFDEAQTVYTTAPGMTLGSDGKPAAHVNPSAFRTLTMASGANITVASGGVISVPSMLSAVGTGTGSWNATPSGKHGRITMNSGSSIDVQSGGKLYVYGYIAGSGDVFARSGSEIRECFQIRSWRGGTATSGMADNSQKVFPINQYYVQNIEAPLTLYSGATEKVFAAVNMSNQQFGATATFVGSGGLLQINNGSSITKRFTGASDRLEITVDGDINISSMSLRITGLPLVGTLDLDTVGYVLPIQSNITFLINSGTTTVTQDVAFLPGSEAVINNGATLKINSGKNVYVYDQSEWGAYAADSAQLVPVGYSTVNGATAKRSNASLVDAKFDVNGSLEAVGYLYSTSSGAAIISSSGTGRILLSTAPGTDTQTYQASQSGTDITYVSIPIASAKLKNGDGSYTETSGSAAGTEFYYCRTCDSNGIWETEHTVVHVHEYGEPLWQWDGYTSATATFTCVGNDDTQVVTAAVEITSTVQPTCTAAGSNVYTATVVFNDETYTDTKTETLDALGHIWGAPVWEWSEDYTTAVATFTCERVAEHFETIDAAVTVADGTGEDAGKTIYTATVVGPDGATYTDVKKVANIYTITWKNYDGTVIDTTEAEYGTVPTYAGEAPVKDADSKFAYRFAAWYPAVKEVTGNAEYTAEFYGVVKDAEPVIDENLTISKKSLTLYSNLSVKYKINAAALTEAGYTNAYIICTMNNVVDGGNTPVARRIAGKLDGDTYVFEYKNIAPQYMGTDIYTVVFAEKADGTLYRSEVNVYSVREYCMNILGKDEFAHGTEYNNALRTLLVDILNYGAESQNYVGYRTGDLANSGLTAEQAAEATPAVPEYTDVYSLSEGTVADPTVTFKGKGLYLDNAVRIRYKIHVDGAITGLKLVVNSEGLGKTWTVAAASFKKIDDDGNYYVYFAGLNFNQLGETVTAVVKDAAGNAVSETMTYSVASYIHNQLAKEPPVSAPLVNLLRTLAKLTVSSQEFLNVAPAGGN
ncbi:MAG: hypothetical protein II789_09815 [Clostridia bacterium]|nr:hypothetical protein [Clostridia bacterium]